MHDTKAGGTAHGPIIGSERLDWGTPRAIRSPYDQRIVGEVHFGDQRTIEAALALAELAFAGFRREPAHRRAAWLRATAAGVRREADSLAAVISNESGKPVRLARLEVEHAAATLAGAADEAVRIPGELHAPDATPEGEGRTGLVRRFPIGPVAAITAFNFPLELAAHKLGAALAAGNTIVLRPASQTPTAAIRLGLLALEAGVPEGVIGVVPCDTADAAPLVQDERVRALSFTGSSDLGWALRARAGRKKVVLELSGNTAAIVEPDADVEAAARKLALGAFSYAGQSCTSVQRIYVHDRITRRFLDALLQFTATQIPWGDPAKEQVLCGPVIDGAGIDRILEWIDQAVASKAALLLPPRREGSILTPAVLTRVREDLPIVKRELFGPAVVVETYRGINRAIELASGTPYGLQASIFCHDLRKVLRAFEEIEVGALIHNDVPSYRNDPLPYGGVKASGLGRGGARWAIETLTEPRLIVLDSRF